MGTQARIKAVDHIDDSRSSRHHSQYTCPASGEVCTCGDAYLTVCMDAAARASEAQKNASYSQFKRK